ncbi:MAG TPA: HEAT repeat domain-containing protein [Kofleriaceae bacterium]|nr:HEAT repeat domain-containing protein [Kofleriaceae bacterium]
MRGVLVVLVVAIAAAAPAYAQPADVPALTKLIENQPADMDRSTWKEKRRDAARKLIQSKDKKAVPTLIKLAESETFDIIGEIAIEGLGYMNDPSAVPVLQKIANDAGRDKAQRDLAKKSLAKLGANADRPAGGGTTGGGTTGGGTTGGGTGTTGGGGTTRDDLGGGGKTGGGLIGESKGAADVPPLPELPDDTIAAFERLTFALGTANLQYDTVRKRASLDADVAAIYAHRVEREGSAIGWDAGAHVVGGFINPEGRAQTRALQLDLTGNGEGRFYSGQLYGIGKAAVGVQLNYISQKDEDPAVMDLKDTRTTADLQVALGGGFGRVIDVGGAIRVRRLSRALDAARALGKPIDAATARKLELTWWALRGQRSSYDSLLATVAILREAGILLGEPDVGLTYEILNVLRDTQLFLRPSGFDVQLLFGEGYLERPEANDAGESERVEQLLAYAAYGKQLANDTVELSGGASARYRLFAPDTDPSPWQLGASARLRRFMYGDHGDPFGAFDLKGEVLVSDDDPLGDDDPELGTRLQGELGFTWWTNQASGIRLAANIALDGDELFFGASLAATYGFLDATFAGL